MTQKTLQLTTPVGRLVAGSLYKPRTTDTKGQPLVVKTGANKGQPRAEYSIGVAFPKTPGVSHWSQEPWMAPIWALGHEAFPTLAQRPDFSWKITDGDSTIPNKKEKRPCDQEGYAGHWVIFFSGNSAPKVVNRDGSQVLPDPDHVKRGYYVQVLAQIKDNKPSETPGLYLNPLAVAFQAFGEEIVGFDVDTTQAGFGQAALPAGASPTPPAGMAPPPVTVAHPAPPPVATPPPPPAPVQPARDFVGKTMTPKAAGVTYEAMIAAGWTDDLLRQQGYML